MALAQTLVVRFLALGLNLLTGIVSARYLGPVGRAEQAAIVLGASFFPYVIAFGVPIAVQYKIRTDPKRAPDYTSAGIGLSLVFGMLAFGIGILVLPRMLVKYPPEIVQIAQIAMVTAPITMLYALLCAILQARGQFRAPNVTRYVMPAITLVSLLGLIVVHRLNPITSSIAYLMTGFFAVPWLWAKVRPTIRVQSPRKAAKDLLSYGSRSYVSDILGTLAAQVDQILVIGLLSPTSMGLYAVALGAARAVDLYSGSVVAVLFPRAASLDTAQIVALTGRAARITGAMLLGTGSLLALLMPLLLPLFFGKAFVASIPVAQIVLVSFAVNAIVYVLAQAYMAVGKPGVNAIIQLIGLATTVPAMLFLIPRYGIVGAALALVASTMVRLLSSLACFPIILKVDAPALLVNAGDVRYVRRAMTFHAQAPSEREQS
jgi:antigen flippase